MKTDISFVIALCCTSIGLAITGIYGITSVVLAVTDIIGR